MSATDFKEPGIELQDIDTELQNVDPAGVHLSANSVGTAYDQRDMRVMGKLQELRVRHLISSLVCSTTENCSEIFDSSPSWVLLVH